MRHPNHPQSSSLVARARRTAGAGLLMFALASLMVPPGYAGGPAPVPVPQRVPTLGPVSFSVNGTSDPQLDALRHPSSGLFYWPWCPPPVPPGGGPYPAMRTTVQVPKANGIGTGQPGDVHDYWLISPMSPTSEAEIFQSEPYSSLAGPPAGPPVATNNQILQYVALGLLQNFANVNAYTFGEDYFPPTLDTAGGIPVTDEPWGGRGEFPGFVEPALLSGTAPIVFYFSVDTFAVGLQGTAVQSEATLGGTRTLPAGPPGSADEGSGGGPWISYGEAGGDVFVADPVNAPGANALHVDEQPMALEVMSVAPPPYWSNMEDDLDALEHVGDNTLFDGTPAEPGNTHDRVTPTSGGNGGSHGPAEDLGDPNNPNHDPVNGNPIIFSVDRGSGGAPGSAVHAQVYNCDDGASGDLFIAVTIPSGPHVGTTTNMLLVDDGQLGLMPHDDLDAVIVKLQVPIDVLEARIGTAASNFDPGSPTHSQGYGFTEPLLAGAEALVAFSVDNGSIGLAFTAVDYEARVDGMGLLGPGYTGSGVMEQGGDIFFADLIPVVGSGLDDGTGLVFSQNYLWFEEMAIGLDRGNWQINNVTGDLSLSPDELNALDSDAEGGGCITDDDCIDFDACTCDRCIAGSCSNLDRFYGDVDCNGVPNVFDIFCILDLLAGDPPAPGCNFSNADIEPCAGNGTLNVFDMFEVLAAIAGNNNCNCPAGPP